MSDILQLTGERAGSRSVLAPSLFAALPETSRAALIAAGRTRRFADGQLVQQRGEDSGGFWLVESGQVSLGQFGADGAFNAVALLGPGDSFGELALLAGRRRVVDAVASGKAELRVIPAAALQRLLVQPADAAALIGALAGQFHEALDLLIAFRRSDGAARLARTLAALAQDQPLPVRLRIGQQALADLVGTSRMTVSAALARLERQGLVRRGYGWIEVLDTAGLVHTSGS
jgi:CRP/FNR family transcriptional regulator, cyclic AMP receptor protein